MSAYRCVRAAVSTTEAGSPGRDLINAREEIVDLVINADNAFDRTALERMLTIEEEDVSDADEGEITSDLSPIQANSQPIHGNSHPIHEICALNSPVISPSGAEEDDDNMPPSSVEAMSVPPPTCHLTDEQQVIFNAIMEAVRLPDHQVRNHRGFAVIAPAGCGKTVLFNKLLQTCRAEGMPAIACALTAIAALLFLDGETCHKTFGIPMRGWTSGKERSFLENFSPEAEKLRKAKLILIDEVSMLSAEQAFLVDELLRMVMGKPDLLFGGKCVVLGGDMAQVLPVIRGLSPRAVAVRAWGHWPQLQKFSLTKKHEGSEKP
ncbi:ATP-dependent DNA helicase [Frankliniella fusca]|uniref:ATP-dependent DNA helicase n=1 Tax=Frankliniella fusca TaxID=407009 RepID=A0AAE1L7Y5_9NEOP|nr:ATP-dependent DNA helicase [Frankliniella fusca]